MKDEILLGSLVDWMRPFMHDEDMVTHAMELIGKTLGAVGYTMSSGVLAEGKVDELWARRRGRIIEGGKGHADWCTRIADGEAGQMGGCICICKDCGEILDDPEDLVYGHCK